MSNIAQAKQPGGSDCDGAAKLHGISIIPIVHETSMVCRTLEAAIGEQHFAGWSPAQAEPALEMRLEWLFSVCVPLMGHTDLNSRLSRFGIRDQPHRHIHPDR